MLLITKAQMHQLLVNGAENNAAMMKDGRTTDFPPVVKLFTPDANATWLLSEIDPENPDIAFGLCDLGMGMPEMGSVSLSELRSVRGKMGLPIERDRSFEAKMTLSQYAEKAQIKGYIFA